MVLAIFSFATLPLSAAELSLGPALPSMTGSVPTYAVNGALHWSRWVLSGSTSGYRSEHFYHSHQTLVLYYQNSFSSWLQAGFGLGGYVDHRGLQTDAELEEDQQVDIGLATRIQLDPGGWGYVAIEHYFGNPLDLVTRRLSTREVSYLIWGFYLW